MKNKKISLEIEGVEKNSTATSEMVLAPLWEMTESLRNKCASHYLLIIKCTKYLLIPVFILLFITLSS